MNERELALAPKPLSGIAQKSPLPASSSAEKPPTGCVEPGAGAGSVLIDAGERRRERGVGGQDRPRLEPRLRGALALAGASRTVKAAAAVMSRLMPGT